MTHLNINNSNIILLVSVLMMVVTVFHIFPYINNKNKHSPNTIINGLTYVGGILILLVGTMFSYFLVIFSVIDFLLVYIANFTMSQIQLDIGTGLLPLRISSVILGVKFLSFIRASTNHPFVLKLNEGNKLTQYAFYIFVLSHLWGFSFNSINTAEVLILNWGFFFIIDDWVIIEGYTKKHNVSPLLGHSLRIIGFNILLALVVIYAMSIHTNASVTTIFMFFWFLFLALLNAPRAKLKHYLRKSEE